MTDREAHDLVRAIEHLWNYDMAPEARTSWTESLSAMNSLHASEAVLRLSQRQKERPTFADVRNMIAKVVRDHDTPTSNELPPAGTEAPLWVRRWLCARYLHDKFEKPQDMRRMPEQGDWVDPRVAVMPDDEWVPQALTITDWDVLATIGGAR